MSEKRSKLIVAKDAVELARTAADVLSRLLEQAAKARGVCSVALAGGRTPRAAYAALAEGEAAARVPWDQVDWFFGDERAVALDHPDSNYRLAMETLFASHPEGIGRSYRMPADADDTGEAARRYGRRLPDPLDVLILGMGEDGHVASLFPGSPALDVKDERVAAIDDAPKPPPKRMTITPPVIARARSIVVLVTGVEKAAMVARALGGALDPKSVPAQLARQGTWIVDQAAAGQVLNP